MPAQHQLALNVPAAYRSRAIVKMLGISAPSNASSNTPSQDKLLLIVADDVALDRLEKQLQFWQLQRNHDFVTLPAWDCLPYDRVSPHMRLVSQRLATLASLKIKQCPIIITTISGCLQKILPPDRVLTQILKINQQIARQELQILLAKLGYQRAVTVREHSEYAIRGDIIDIFPAGCDEPLRLEFFGDMLEKINPFDVVSQRTDRQHDLSQIQLISATEIPAGAGDIFKKNYLRLFGRLGDEYLLQAVQDAVHYPGLEHWLPLFFENDLVSLFDWLADDTMLVVDDLFQSQLQMRCEMVEENYQARHDKMPKDSAAYRKMQQDQKQAIYAAIPSNMLYLDMAAFASKMAKFQTVLLSPVQENISMQKTYHDFQAKTGISYLQDFQQGKLLASLQHRFVQEAKKSRQVIIACVSEGSRTRLSAMLEQEEIYLPAIDNFTADCPCAIAVLECDSFEDENLVLISEHDLFGQRVRKNYRRRKSVPDMLTELNALNMGDYVVHAEHGIARYEGLKTIEAHQVPYECLHLAYANRASLYVPVENIDLLSRYGGSDLDNVKLDSLGLNHWQQRKARMKKHLLEIAEHLVDTAAKRQLKTAPIANYEQKLWDQFCAGFPFVETDDQLQVIEQITEDFQKGVPMDRLVCGDAGFGKTEIALRAAFQMVFSNRQVILIAPTTLLVRQHYRLFCKRFENFEVNIVELSRLTSSKDATIIREDIKNGKAQIIIGTHRVLSKTLTFHQPGLLIVDEEQHFGVKQKEQLKQWSDLHILTLTATPIPRSLNFALSGLRDLSLITTPPVDRLSVRTFAMPYDDVILAEAIRRELLRGGQIFCVCPRIADLPRIELLLRSLSKDIRMAVAHGQMPSQNLEKVMQQFVDGQLDLLLSTNIVESGLDIPRANTIFIFRPDKFGLSQLYQLRGRVGRSRVRGYCYLILPRHNLTAQTLKRMEIMQSLDAVGAGFQIASHDLDLRGGGNLLGEAQSGKISEIGVELYHQMLQQAIHKVKGEEEIFADEFSPQVRLDITVMIPEDYVSDLSLRMGLYQRLAKLNDVTHIDEFAIELADRFGALPKETQHLLQVMRIRLLCRALNISILEAGTKGLTVQFREHYFAAAEKLLQWVQKNSDRVSIDSQHRLVITQGMADQESKLKRAKQLLTRLQQMIES